MTAAAVFQQRILDWFDCHGRKNLPWQINTSPYRVWISEIMLQQTQVSTVIPYFNVFIRQFPDIAILARSPLDSILHLWSGLGYYARARNIHKTAQFIDQRGHFPDTLADLIQLPGIGRSTAGAILSIAFNDSHAILDGNVKRVLSRYQGISGWPGDGKVSKELWTISEALTPVERVADYTQAMMDLGATLCKRSNPLCGHCPINSNCIAYLEQRTVELPSPKPKTRLPVKTKIFLVLQDRKQQILIYKRPPVGVWGGLWSVPEFDGLDLAIDWCEKLPLKVTEVQKLAERRHTFSHFHLDYTPVVISVDNPGNVVKEDQLAVWYNPKEQNERGLPAPIKRLLEQLNLRIK